MNRALFLGILLCAIAAVGVQTVVADVMHPNYRLEPFARTLQDPEAAAFAPDARRPCAAEELRVGVLLVPSSARRSVVVTAKSSSSSWVALNW